MKGQGPESNWFFCVFFSLLLLLLFSLVWVTTLGLWKLLLGAGYHLSLDVCYRECDMMVIIVVFPPAPSNTHTAFRASSGREMCVWLESILATGA